MEWQFVVPKRNKTEWKRAAKMIQRAFRSWIFRRKIEERVECTAAMEYYDTLSYCERCYTSYDREAGEKCLCRKCGTCSLYVDIGTDTCGCKSSWKGKCKRCGGRYTDGEWWENYCVCERIHR